MCGEKFNLKEMSKTLLGSPPRMRGKVGVAAYRGEVLGITPAYAGKSRPQKAPHTAGRDHPRVCGEKLRIVEVGRVKEGSPPRVRGKVET